MNSWVKVPLLIALFPALVVANSQSPLQHVDWLLYQGMVEKAQKVLNDVDTTKSNELEVNLLKVRIDLASNELDEAADNLEHLIEQHPKQAELYYWQGRVNAAQAQQASIFSAAGYAKASKKGFQMAVELDPQNIQSQRGLMQFYLQAPAIVGGSAKKAKEVAATIMKIDKLHGTMAQLSIAQRDEDEQAIADLLKQLETKFSSSPTALYTVGIHYQQEKQFDKAFKLFSQASALKETDRYQQESLRKFEESKLSALYQIGRNGVFSELNIAEGIEALNLYVQAEIPNHLPSKDWAQFRLSKLYQLNDQAALAKPILLALKAETKDDDLAKQVKKELKSL